MVRGNPKEISDLFIYFSTFQAAGLHQHDGEGLSSLNLSFLLSIYVQDCVINNSGTGFLLPLCMLSSAVDFVNNLLCSSIGLF